jgi:hypothetical protein
LPNGIDSCTGPRSHELVGTKPWAAIIQKRTIVRI